MKNQSDIADTLLTALLGQAPDEARLERAGLWFEALDTPFDRRSFTTYLKQLQRELPADSPLLRLRERWSAKRLPGQGFDEDSAAIFLQDYLANLDPNLLFKAPITCGYAQWQRADLARGFAFATRVQQAWSLLLCARGGARLRGGGRDIELRPGRILLLAPGALHSLHPLASHQQWAYHWTVFHPASRWRDWLEWPSSKAGIARLQPGQEQCALLEALFGELAASLQEDTALSAELSHNLLEQILLRCRRLFPSHQRPTRDQRIERARAFVASHYAESFSLQEVARASNLSVSRLAGLFRAQCGLSVLGYRDELRMAEAARLLRDSRLDIATVAARVGYSDPAYFSRMFSRHVGVAPRSYQQQA